MECTEALSALQPYLHSELNPGRMRGVQLHLGGCKGCRNRLAELRHSADVVIPFYLPAYVQEDLPHAERRVIETHLVYCEFCRAEATQLRSASNEIIKNLSQYQLTRAFRDRIKQEWKPHRVGKRTRYNQRGLADLIERAEAGNTFSYERHVDHFKDYAYIAAYMAVRDFYWAEAIARQIFVRGMPVFDGELTQTDFLVWLHERAQTIAREEGWEEADAKEDAAGLSGYTGSRKLRRHRLILALYEILPESAQVAFLLYHVQRVSYAEIASLLDLTELDVQAIISASMHTATERLADDNRLHPTRRRPWER